MVIRIEEQVEQVPGCNCVRAYRRIIRLRRTMFQTYRDQGNFSEAQLGAMLICMFTAGDEAERQLEKLVGKKKRATTEFESYLRKLDLERERENGTELWNLLSHLQVKGWRGRRLQGRTLLLYLDALLLFWYPNGYSHLQRDDLSTRLWEYIEKKRPSTKREVWAYFWKAVKATEMSSKRIWQAIGNEPPKAAPREWWFTVARQLQLTAEKPVWL